MIKRTLEINFDRILGSLDHDNPPEGEDMIELDNAISTIHAALSDAARWRALIQCARLRVMGTAGFGSSERAPHADGSRHVGLEMWTVYPLTHWEQAVAEVDRRDAVDLLVQFTDIVQQKATET